MIKDQIEPVFVDSELKVTASEDLNILDDLKCESSKTIAELLHEKKEQNNIREEKAQRE